MEVIHHLLGRIFGVAENFVSSGGLGAHMRSIARAKERQRRFT
jgi:hypothetical protein